MTAIDFWQRGMTDWPQIDSAALPIMRAKGIPYSEAKKILRAERIAAGKSSRRPSLPGSRGATGQTHPDRRTAGSTSEQSGNPTSSKPMTPAQAVSVCAAIRSASNAPASADPYAPRQALEPNSEADALAKQIVALTVASSVSISSAPAAPRAAEEAAGAIVAAYRQATQ